LSRGAETRVREIPGDFSGDAEFLALRLDFSIRGDLFSASLGRSGAIFPGEEISLVLPEPFTGEGSLQLGGLSRERPGPEGAGKFPELPLPGLTAILDELALTYTAEEFLAPESGTAFFGQETRTAEDPPPPKQDEDFPPV
jgi:hypothetical protein